MEHLEYSMPSKTQAQHKAMEAAAHGKSNLGIPKKVGKDFEKADKGKKFSTQSMANALRKKPGPKAPPDAEPQEP
jgi:hypothetical protein